MSRQGMITRWVSNYDYNIFLHNKNQSCLSVFFALQTKKKRFPAIVYVQRWMVWCTSDITSLDNQRTKGIRQNVVSIKMLDAVIMEKSVCYNFKPLSYSWLKDGWFAAKYSKIQNNTLISSSNSIINKILHQSFSIIHFGFYFWGRPSLKGINHLIGMNLIWIRLNSNYTSPHLKWLAKFHNITR